MGMFASMRTSQNPPAVSTLRLSGVTSMRSGPFFFLPPRRIEVLVAGLLTPRGAGIGGGGEALRGGGGALREGGGRRDGDAGRGGSAGSPNAGPSSVSPRSSSIGSSLVRSLFERGMDDGLGWMMGKSGTSKLGGG